MCSNAVSKLNINQNWYQRLSSLYWYNRLPLYENKMSRILYISAETWFSVEKYSMQVYIYFFKKKESKNIKDKKIQIDYWLVKIFFNLIFYKK